MSGVAVIRYLLANYAPLIAVIPATRIQAGEPLPLGIDIPCIGVKLISGTPRNTVAMNESLKLHTDRVQVTVLQRTPQATPSGDGYPALDQAAKYLLPACTTRTATVNEVMVRSIEPDMEGPDLSDMTPGVISRSRDFIVRYLA